MKKTRSFIRIIIKKNTLNQPNLIGKFNENIKKENDSSLKIKIKTKNGKEAIRAKKRR